MPVTLPTSADVRKAREQAAKNTARNVEAARTPLLAALGASDLAVTLVSKAVADARARAAAQAEDAQKRVASLPQRVSSEDLRRAVAELRAQAESAYAEFARRGERTWGRLRTQPQVKEAIATVEAYTEKLDARVDELVDDAHDAAEKALATVSTRTRSTGERVARATQRVTGRAAATVTEVSRDASAAVAEAGAETAEAIAEAGTEAAHETRSTTRRAANRTAPRAEAAPTTAPARKPAPRRAAASKADKAAKAAKADKTGS